MLVVFAIILHGTSSAQDRIQLGFPVSKFAPWKTPDAVLAIGGHNVAVIGAEDLKVSLNWQFEDVRISDAAVVSDFEGRASEGGFLLASGTMNGNEGYLGLFRVSDRTAIWENKALSAPITVLCTAGAKCIAGNDAGIVTEYDLQDGRAGWSHQLHSKLVTAIVKISHTQMASADWVGKLVLFEAVTGREITNFQQHRDRITGMIADRSSSPIKLYSGSRDGTVRLWYPTQRRLVRFAQLDKAVVAIAPLGENRILASTTDSQLHVVDLNSAKVIAQASIGQEYVQTLWPVSERSFIGSDGRLSIFLGSVPATRAQD